ncbi:MAG: Phosphoadenosine phosphosulfate reductase [Candidatus Moanabacter tarae]|uniref:Adenosine 5'-phosphosulfate reductase n=1 Tax=Candidatus Moanibacter tarae TaxID=2200854 RepID=A0A2Z4AFS4_9BACT|nr:MAG: Phosphoadenosine phosphosulfate reductase [Candidatus Moanabacter tarae]|tara:strand:+ start:17104 stop:17847 length:744 start_codon:yes stop_codon:yes gene_type:complete
MKSFKTKSSKLDCVKSIETLDRVKLIHETYGSEAIHLSSMQKTSGVIMHMISRLKASIRIVFIDTQFHFPETLEIRDLFIERFGLNIDSVKPELSPEEQLEKYGIELSQYIDGQPLCCSLRKEQPLMKAKETFKFQAMINGVMREEGRSRGKINFVSLDPRLDCKVFHPLFDWSFNEVDAYISEHKVPINKLYAKGYESIGCSSCTTAVFDGEDVRAGRWRHLRSENGEKPNYCGLNFLDHNPTTKV